MLEGCKDELGDAPVGVLREGLLGRRAENRWDAALDVNPWCAGPCPVNRADMFCNF